MSEDLTSLENELRKLRPAALDEALVDRLDQCAAGAWQFSNALELEFEQRMRSHETAPLDEAMTQRLLACVGDLPFPAEPPKILPFPNIAPATPRRKNASRHWAAAAAVALFGALAGFLVPHAERGKTPASTAGRSQSVEQVQTRQTTPPAPSPLVPAGYGRGLSEATDEGVVFNEECRPHRVLKFVYQERVTLKDADGRTYEVERPRVEYLIVPAKTD